MKKDMAFEFETLGQLSIQDAVVSLAKTPDGAERIFVTVLTEGLTANHRKDKLTQARAELNSNIINHGSVSGLGDTFTDVNIQQTQAKVTDPASASSLVQYMLTKTDKPIVILDCQDKSSFWQSLRSLGVDHNTLLALAELEHLKPENSSTKQTKPVGQAHLLCESLAKGNSRLSEFTKPKDIIERVRKARKIKIPYIDVTQHMLIASANGVAEKRENPEPLTILGINVEKAIDLKVRFLKAVGINKTKTPEQQAKANRRVELVLAHKHYVDRHNSLTRALFKRELSVEEVAEQSNILQEEYKRKKKEINSNHSTPSEPKTEKTGEAVEKLKKFEGLDSIFTMNKWASVDLNIRDGYHFLRHNECLFEFDTQLNDIPFTAFVLASQKDAEIEMEFFLRRNDNGVVIDIPDEAGRVILDANMQMQRWSVYNPETGDSIISGKSEAFEHYRKNNQHTAAGYLGHIMDVTARMNDPDYAIVEIEPTGGKARQGKHVFPYFAYELVENPLERVRIRSLSRDPNGTNRSSPVFHPVARHVRTYHRGTSDEYVIIIDEHHRGDPSKGVKGRTTMVADQLSAKL